MKLSTISLLSLAYTVVLPLASTFGVGIHAGTIAPIRNVAPNRFSPSSALTKIQSSSAAKNKSAVLMQPSDSNNAEKEQKREEEESRGPAGEHESNLLSRLLYIYVAPLIKISSERQLDPMDVLPVSDSYKMDKQVPELERIYARCKAKARRRQQNLEASSMETKDKSLKERIERRISKSESLVLAKALFLHQKRNIILTGMLRFLNTAIQAFPAVLVARLLRLIEAGDTAHPSKAIRAAFDLVAVLTVKMIVENQYFHRVVKCSTMIRGSLAGMIFDKSLKVSTNGSHHRGDNEDEGASGASKSDAKKSTTGGDSSVLNLMQSDVSIIEMTALQIHTIWDGLLQISIYSTLLYKYLGSSVFWGISVLLLTIPTNAFCLRILNRLGIRELEAKDLRTKKTSEAITNMKLLKLQAWEKHFEKGIETARKEELRRHINRGAFRALNQAISNAVPAIVLVVTLTAYRKTGNPIVASTIFTAISLFNQLRFPLLFYPMVIDALANGKNALGRLSSYLCQEDLTRYVQKLPKSKHDGGGIQMKNGNFLWSKPSSASLKKKRKDSIAVPALCGAEFEVKSGEIVAVVGSVGSGKSALIKALLGELEPVPRLVVDASMGHSSTNPVTSSVNDMASVTTIGNVAYCSQEAWLSKGTIKDAVVFGREYDERRYLTAIYAAGLDDDIKSGTLSHETEVGEGGSSLSGGQRARVQLARALYEENTGVYLLDDPLSALDAAVGATVFDRITETMRQRNAAVVFVTNDASLPRRCDRVILMGKMKSGPSSSRACSHIVDIGTYNELLSRGHDLNVITVHPNASESLGKDSSKQDTEQENIEKFQEGNGDFPVFKVDLGTELNTVEETNIQDSPKSVVMLTNATEYVDGGNVDSKKSVKDFIKEKSTMDDTMSKEAVPLSTYTAYLKSARNPVLIAAALSCYLLSNGAQFFQQYTVAKWTELGSGASSAMVGGKYLQSLVYAAGVVSVFLWLRSFLLMKVGVKASEFLHNGMLRSIFNSPVTFFDSTPSGQLLSRFGKELETVDRGVPDGIGSVLFCFLNIAMTCAGLAGLMTPGMVFPLLFISAFYTKIMSKFRPTARDLKRFESKSRSPIYTQFGEALKGAETIRSFPNSSQLWSRELRSLVDRNLNVIYTVKSLDRWLSIRLESLGNVVVLTAAFASVFLTRTGRLKSGSAGWGLTQSLAITGLLTWAVRCLTDLETQMMSVLRITEVAGLNIATNESKIKTSIPQEMGRGGEALEALFGSKYDGSFPSSPTDDRALVASGWPWKGGVSFKNVSMRYSPSSDLALKNVNLEIPAGSTLGVVGRTGSGKSTLLVTLFRLVEIESGGSISIDGVDIRSVSLQTLRESLSIIPQDPVLFRGTLMYNLDATGKASKEDAWKALEAASPEMARTYRASTNGLDSTIAEGGKNLSAGQRQLICLARALLRKSKILVLDEATSSVDPKTDAQVQETIRSEFVDKGVSVITVAHRLDTVLGSDKIAVLGDGALIEYGTPEELLRIKDGQLRRLVEADTNNKKKALTSNPLVDDEIPLTV